MQNPYNLLWNETELLIEFFQPTNENQLVKVFETRMNRQESQKYAQQINRIANIKLSNKDKLMTQKPLPPQHEDLKNDSDNDIENLGI